MPRHCPSLARRLGVTVSLLASLLAAGACGARPEQPAAAGPLRIRLYTAPLGSDPHLESEFLTYAVLSNTFEGLTRLDPHLHVEPALAESWESPNDLTWRLHLRRGVRFHDGRRLTAADVVFSLERARRRGLGITVHTGESGPIEEIGEVIRYLEPSRIGHGVKSAYDPRTMAMIREREITLEVCPTSNLNSRVVSGWAPVSRRYHCSGLIGVSWSKALTLA